MLKYYSDGTINLNDSIAATILEQQKDFTAKDITDAIFTAMHNREDILFWSYEELERNVRRAIVRTYSNEMSPASYRLCTEVGNGTYRKKEGV